MEKELNIAAILKEKPRVKVWSDTLGELRFDFIINEQTDAFPIVLTAKNGNGIRLTKDGRYYNDVEGVLPCIVPSKEMRDWSKFAWKKGDVLFCGVDNFCIFDKWANNQYTEFYGRYSSQNYSKEYDKLDTECWTKVGSNGTKQAFIKRIEEFHNGKLNLSTLQIEQPKQEFKDGDIVTAKFYDDGVEMICIFKEKDDEFYMGYCGVFSTGELKGRIILDFEEDCIGEDNECNLRIATDSEKQQLFNALAKEGKAWDAEKKMLVDLPKKCEFKPMDWCLMRDIKEKWKLCQFGFCDKEDEYEASYNAVGGNWYNECIPYNDSTKHLLGTTDEWKGGEG